MARRVLVLLLALLPLAAQQPTLKEVVERFDAAQAQVQTLQAPFTLTIRRAMMRTPTVAKGTLSLQGSDFVHMVFLPPEDLVLHLTPKELLSWRPDTRQAERLKIGFLRNANRRFLGLGQKLSYLQEYFQIGLGESRDQPGTLFLSLLPRSLSLRKRMQVVNLWVDKETWLPRQVQWVERSGDAWLLELGTLRLNQALPKEATAFKLPEGVAPAEDFSFFGARRK